MLFFDADAVDRLLPFERLIPALHAAHRQDPAPVNETMVMDSPNGGDAFVALLAWAGGEAIAAKLVGVFPGNLARDPPEPSVQGIVALFDGQTGAPRLVCDGAAMTFRKTAADSGLGASLLARPDAHTLLVVGAGGLAPHVVAAHRAARPSLQRILLWNRGRARAEALAARLAPLGPVVVDDLDAAVAEADIISSVTMATVPLIHGRKLKPGTHVDLVGAYRPDMREADDEVIRRGFLFADTRKNVFGSGDFGAPLAAGLITPERVEADLYDLCRGRHPGRRSPEDITVYKNVGGAHLDLFTVRALLAEAEREG